jgi:MFS family permease
MTSNLLIAQMLVNPLIGWLGDRWGHRFTLAAGMLSAILSNLLVLIAPDATWLYPAFALAAVGSAVSITSILAITVEFGEEHERPYYIGLGNTLIAPVSLVAPLIGGALADSLGYDATFKLACGAAALGIAILLFLLRDPRMLRQAVPTMSATPAEAG